MKRFLWMIVVMVLWCNFTSAEILLKDCSFKRKDGTFKKIREGKKHEYFISFKDGKIYKVVMTSLERIKAYQEFKDKYGVDLTRLVESGRVKNIEFQITFVDSELISGKRLEQGTYYDEPYYLYEEIFINLKDNTVEYLLTSDDILGRSVIETREFVTEEQFGRKNLIFKCYMEDLSDSPDETGPLSGTAFFINNKGNLLTNNHVVEGCEVSKINYFNKEYDTELIATDKILDLALLKAEVKPKSFISFSKKEPKKRQNITVAGYPLGKYLSDDLKINDGKISALKGFDNNSNEIQHDIPINPGNSGGPIVNENGELVAVAVSGMAKDITEGLNFGIKSSAVENFLTSNKININVGEMKFSMSIDKVNKLLEESTVYTFCN
jgi:hypothetical protein